MTQQTNTPGDVAASLESKFNAFCNSLSPEEQSAFLDILRRRFAPDEADRDATGYAFDGFNLADAWYVLTHRAPFGQKSDGTPWKL